jgi:opacity protein-like surface antigen
MRFSILAAMGVAAACLISTAATAADLVVDTPMAAPTSVSNWDGFYAGIQSGYDLDGFVPIQGVVGVNMTVSEAFLIGVELAGGPYLDVGGGGGPGYEGYLAGRAGVLVGPALLYGMAGVNDVDGGFNWLVGAGAEFSVTDNLSARFQVAQYDTTFTSATAGVFWHF